MGDQYTVYKHTAPNGKCYIGVTCIEPKKRWNNGHGYKGNNYFSRAINKYGWDNIQHDILFTGLTKEQAFKQERELIALYCSSERKYGYNLTDGGEIGKKHAQDTIQRMSLAKIGKYDGKNNPRYGAILSEETRKKISKALKGKFAGEKNPNYGKQMSDDQKKKISDARKGKHYQRLSESVKNSKLCIAVHNQQKIKIDQYSTSGEYIRTWDSAPDASVALLGHRMGQSNICSCSNGKLKTAYGYIWKHHIDKGSGE